jgi:hypothetical protein
MRVKVVILCGLVLLLSSCQHLDYLFAPLLMLKAVIQGQVKGVLINCEKVVSVQEHWHIMCKIGDDIMIKYRTTKLDYDNTRLEVMIDKAKGNRRKIIAEPVLVVSRNQPALLNTIGKNSHINIRAELVL